MHVNIDLPTHSTALFWSIWHTIVTGDTLDQFGTLAQVGHAGDNTKILALHGVQKCFFDSVGQQNWCSNKSAATAPPVN